MPPVMVMVRVLCWLDCWWCWCFLMVWMLVVVVLGAGPWMAWVWSLVTVGWLLVLV